MKEKHKDLTYIAQQFFPELSNELTIRVLEKGNINASFLFDHHAQTYLLQRINQDVFPKTELILQNIQRVYEHLLKTDPELALIQLIPTKDGAPAWIHQDGAYWRVIPFIANSISYATAPTLDYAYEGAKMAGRFLKSLENLNSTHIQVTIPDFHNSMLRLRQMQEAVEADPVDRCYRVKEQISFIQKEASIFKKIRKASLPLRVVHNDAKMDNILFDKASGRPLGLIDWDTIMPGTLLSDYGDLVRTSINPVAEDSDQLDQIVIDQDLLRTLEEGFLYHTQDMLDRQEKDLLPLAPLWITLEQAMRFLTDYLMGDVYYRTEFEGHNMVRVMNQIQLFRRLKYMVPAVDS
jgi:aminoglycoside phosphotransferase (APT) family kinase protein